MPGSHIKEHLHLCHPEAWDGLTAASREKLRGEKSERRETRRRALQNERRHRALCPARGAGQGSPSSSAAPSVRAEGRPVARGQAGRGGRGPGRPRRPLLRARRERPARLPALSCSHPSLRCPRPRSLFGAETPLTSEPLARRSLAPRACSGPQTARRAAQSSLAGPPPALPAASPSLPGPPGLPLPRPADSSAGTGGCAVLSAAARAF